jgi:hypothetical protein
VKQISKRLTYANVVSSMALFLVLTGATAFAASKIGSNGLKSNSVTTAKIKKNAVTASKIKKNAVTNVKIKNGSVSNAKLGDGSVTSTKVAAGAIGAAQLANGSVGNAQTSLVKVFKAGAVPAGSSEAGAPRIELGSVGPFKFYGKCFSEGGNIEEKTYIELTSGVATLGSEDAAEFESDADGYLTSGTPEVDRAIEEDASAGPNKFSANSDDEEFQATASDGTQITGLAAGTGAKQGNPPAGNGPFLAGDSCIVGTVAVFGA